MKSQILATVVALSGSLLFTPAIACGPSTNCTLDDRTYRIRMPEGHDGASKVGAIIFNHGYRGTAAGLMRNKRLGKAVSDMGLAFVATKSKAEDWAIPNSPSPKDPRGELPYFDALKQDLTENHFVDSKRIMISGFSAGGMMTWELACHRGNSFAGFAPISGTFWAPVPKTCDTLPANMIHMHGTSDRVVPMAGRKIGPTSQGDVHKALKLAAVGGEFGKWKSLGDFDGIACQQRSSKTGKLIQLCLHPGGHTFKPSWLIRAWNELEKARPSDG